MGSEKFLGRTGHPHAEISTKKNPNFSIFGLKLTFFDSNGPTDSKNEFDTIKNFWKYLNVGNKAHIISLYVTSKFFTCVGSGEGFQFDKTHTCKKL